MDRNFKSAVTGLRESPINALAFISSNSLPVGILEERPSSRILGLLSNYAPNPHTLWHTNNIQYYPSVEMQKIISELLTKYFRMEEVRLVIPYMEQGITRGSFSFLVFLVVDLINDAHMLLKELSFKDNINPEMRNFCFWLYMHLAKFHSVEETLVAADLYLSKFPFGYDDEALLGVRESIQNGELLPIG